MQFHASHTEDYLMGKILLDNKTLQSAIKILNEEIDPDRVLPDPSPKFRKTLAINLFYKVIDLLKSFRKYHVFSSTKSLEHLKAWN